MLLMKKRILKISFIKLSTNNCLFVGQLNLKIERGII